MTSPAGDDPIETEAEDRLNRTEFAGQVVSVIQAVEAEDTSCVFGLMGPWGSGKSSVLNLIRTDIEQEGGEVSWKVVEFNAWMVSELEALVLEFFTALGSAIGTSEPAIRERIAGYAGQLVPAARLLKVVGIDASGVLEAIKDGLSDRKSLDEQYKAIVEDLSRRAKPILVVVDDIDRLQPEELSLVFKLIRLLGRLPYVHYLIAYDEETVISTLKATRIASGSSDRARAYLEKIVQYRLDLPPVHRSQAWKMWADRMDEILRTRGIELDEGAIERLGSCWYSAMFEHLDTPRAINRYTKQVDAVWPLLANEADFVDVAVVTYLRVFEPGLFELVRARRDELVHDPGVIEPAGARPGVASDNWSAHVENAGVPKERVAGVLALLGVLFPRLAKQLPARASARRHATDDELSSGQRVGSAEYFERYFHYGVVPGVDVRDETVAEAVRNYCLGTPDGTWKALLDGQASSEARVAWKILREWDKLELDDWGVVIEMGADLYNRTPASSGLLGTDRILIASSAARVLATRPIESVSKAIGGAAAIDPSLDYVTELSWLLRSWANDGQLIEPDRYEAVRVAVSRLLKESLQNAAQSPLTDDTFRNLQRLADLSDDLGQLHALVWELIDDEETAWDLDALLARCVPIDNTPPPSAIDARYPGNFSSEIERLIGLQAVADRIGDLEPYVFEVETFDEDVSDENRRKHALRAVALAQAAGGA